jgi:DNA-binding PadR family transcriptional regulator
MSSETLRILAVMLEDPLAWQYSLGLSASADVAAGTIYPMVARLEKAGWLESRWEEPDASERGRPRRRLYRLTGHGERAAMAELDEIVEAARKVKRARSRRGQLRKRLA